MLTLDQFIAARVAEEAARRRPEPKRQQAKNARGLVIYPPMKVTATGAKFGTHLDAQELRFALLFWDKLDYPSNNLVYAAPDPNAEFLIRAGVLQRTHAQMVGEFSGGDVFRLPFLRALEMLDEKEPATWSVATGERSISFLDSELQSGRGALVSLHRAIPVPDQDVPLDDILKFREKRRSELLAFRYHLDGIYNIVTNAADCALVLNSETEALERAAIDFIKSARGFGLKWRLADLGANLDLAAGAAAGWHAYQKRLSTLDALVAGAGATVAVKAAVGLVRARSPKTPFRYVFSYHNELFPLS
jgi:hypothetical protein